MEFLSAKREEQEKTKAESPTKIQEKREIPLVIPLNAIAEEELTQPDFSWLNRTFGGVGKID